jgi:hypothetical protein
MGKKESSVYAVLNNTALFKNKFILLMGGGGGYVYGNILGRKWISFGNFFFDQAMKS